MVAVFLLAFLDASFDTTGRFFSGILAGFHFLALSFHSAK